MQYGSSLFLPPRNIETSLVDLDAHVNGQIFHGHGIGEPWTDGGVHYCFIENMCDHVVGTMAVVPHIVVALVPSLDRHVLSFVHVSHAAAFICRSPSLTAFQAIVLHCC